MGLLKKEKEVTVQFLRTKVVFGGVGVCLARQLSKLQVILTKKRIF